MFGGGLELKSRVVERRAESAERFGARIERRHALRDQMIDAARDERVELVVDVAASRGA